MTFKQTFLGEAQGKSVSSLTISDCTVRPNAAILVGVVLDKEDGTCDTVKWGTYELGRECRRAINPDFNNRSPDTQIWSILNTVPGGTEDIVVTFSASINAAVCFAVEVDGITTRDQVAGATNGKTTSSPGPVATPDVTFGSNLATRRTFVFHVYGSTGSYTGGTFGSPTGSGFTYSGETLGTTTGGATNNMFYRYYYAITTSTTAVAYGRGDDSVGRWKACVQANYYYDADHRTDALELFEHFDNYTDYIDIVQGRNIDVEIYDSDGDTYTSPPTDPKDWEQIQRAETDLNADD
jgi:hypothetical protein